MRKYISFILASLLAITLSACSGNEAELAAMQAQIDALSKQINSDGVSMEEYNALIEENEALKAQIAQLEIDAAQAAEAVQQSAPREEHQVIADAVSSLIQSEHYAQWQELYTYFTGDAPSEPEIVDVVRYQIGDFDGEKIDCYLINLSADIGYWYNEANEQGSIENNVFIFADNESKAIYDNISTNAMNVEHNTTTDFGRATYLLWTYGNAQLGNGDSVLLNNAEIITELSSEDVDTINANIHK